MTTKTKKRTTTTYEPVARLPLARFFYQGAHSHPVRRTVIIIAETKETITGYELREGTEVRSTSEVVRNKMIKTYRKDNIPKWGDYSRLRMTTKTCLKDPEASTLERFPILTMFSEGA